MVEDRPSEALALVVIVVGAGVGPGGADGVSPAPEEASEFGLEEQPVAGLHVVGVGHGLELGCGLPWNRHGVGLDGRLGMPEALEARRWGRWVRR